MFLKIFFETKSKHMCTAHDQYVVYILHETKKADNELIVCFFPHPHTPLYSQGAGLHNCGRREEKRIVEPLKSALQTYILLSNWSQVRT